MKSVFRVGLEVTAELHLTLTARNRSSLILPIVTVIVWVSVAIENNAPFARSLILKVNLSHPDEVESV